MEDPVPVMVLVFRLLGTVRDPVGLTTVLLYPYPEDTMLWWVAETGPAVAVELLFLVMVHGQSVMVRVVACAALEGVGKEG